MIRPPIPWMCMSKIIIAGYLTYGLTGDLDDIPVPVIRTQPSII
jgi:hypothetical protein